MCTFIPIALAIASTAFSIYGAVQQQQSQKALMSAQNQQLKFQARGLALKADQQENLRRQQAMSAYRANLATVGASGFSQNVSFEKGLQPANDRAAEFDIANIRLNELMGTSRIASQISVNNMAIDAGRQQMYGSIGGSLLRAGGMGYDYYRTSSGPSQALTGGGASAGWQLDR